MKIKEMPKIKVRNQVALSPLLHKGGMHETERNLVLNIVEIDKILNSN